MKKVYLGIFVVILLIVAHIFLGRNLGLKDFQSIQVIIVNTYNAGPIQFIVFFFILYVLAAACSLPIATLLSLEAGALFGVFYGTLIVSFASTLGATLAFLSVRWFFRDLIQQKFQLIFKKIEDRWEKDGALYLLSARLAPVFPFYLINLVFGLTNIKTRQFYGYSQLGMLPGTVIYLNAGAQLSQIHEIKDIMQGKIILSLCLLALFPLVAKKLFKR